MLCDSDESVVVVSRASEAWLDVVWSLWTQQWPALRWDFSFAIGSRQPSPNRFDLQVVTHPTAPTAIEGGLEQRRQPGGRPGFRWLAADLVVRDARLRRLLLRYGPTLEPTRKSVAHLATGLHPVEEHPASDLLDYEKLLVSVGGLRSLTNSVSLMHGVAGGVLTRDADLTVVPEAIALRALVHVGVGNLDPDIVDFRARVESWWATSPDEAFSTLQQATADSWHWRDQFGRVSASAALEAIAMRLRALPDSNIVSWVEAIPELATNVELWSAFPEHEAAIAEVVVKSSNSGAQRDRVVRAVMQSRAQQATHVLVAGWGLQAIRAALRSEAASNRRLARAWQDEIRGHKAELYGEAQEIAHDTDEFVALVRTEILDMAILAQTVSPDLWHTATTHPRAQAERLSSLLWTGGFLSSMNHQDPNKIQFLIEFFVLLHEAIANGNYPDDLWRLLESRLVRPKRFRAWDRCERLRRTTVHETLKVNGDIQLLRGAVARISNAEALEAELKRVKRARP